MTGSIEVLHGKEAKTYLELLRRRSLILASFLPPRHRSDEGESGRLTHRYRIYLAQVITCWDTESSPSGEYIDALSLVVGSHKLCVLLCKATGPDRANV
jgi:hypothetical protein